MMTYPILRLLKPAALVACYVMLAACTSHGTAACRIVSGTSVPHADISVYECNDDFNFVVRIAGGKALLLLPSGTVDLPRMTAASGAKYSNGQVTFWSKGKDALLEIDRETRRSCKNNQVQVLWDVAKSLKHMTWGRVGPV